MSPFLELPAEILELVLAAATTASFVQLAYSSSALRSFAVNNRRLLLHHLHQTPGTIDPRWQSLDSPQLFRQLCQKAVTNLSPGFQVGRSEFTFDDDEFNASVSLFFRKDQSLFLALVSDAPCRLTIYNMGADKPHFQRFLKTSYGASTPIQVLCVAAGTDENTISVVVKHTSISDMSEAVMKPEEYLKAIHFILDPHPHQKNEHHFPLFKRDLYRPLAMAVQNSGKFAISWQHEYTRNEECVALYTESHTRNGDLDIQEGEADESILINRNDISDRRRPPGPVTHLSFNDCGTQLLYSQATSPIYEYYQKLNSHDFRPSRVFRNYSNAVWRQGAFVTSEVLIGTPFFCIHSQSQTAQGSFCHWTYLALGTVINHSAQSKEAYLVRSEAVCRSNNCTHRPNLDRGRRLSDWVSVADLRDYDTLMGSATQGTISYAISGRRIAIASEHKICIWSLIPDAVIQGTAEYGGVYRDLNLQERYLYLEPDTIEIEQDILQHQFSQDDLLVLLTSKGVSYLRLGLMAKEHSQTSIESPWKQDGKTSGFSRAQEL